MVEFGRDICSQPYNAAQLEWLVTNGLGGYASGTVSGELARRYHGLLVAAIKPPVMRALLVTKLDEIATYRGERYELYSENRLTHFPNRKTTPHIERFRLDGTNPVWDYGFADALIEKRIWMEQGQDTTYVQYTVLRASAPVHLQLHCLVNHRDHHATMPPHGISIQAEPVENGVRLMASGQDAPFYIYSTGVHFTPGAGWQSGYWLTTETERGQDDIDAHYLGAIAELELAAGEQQTFILTTERIPDLDGTRALSRNLEYTANLLKISGDLDSPAWVKHLVLSADQFIVKRSLGDAPGKTVMAGYHWFSDWGRDTMISLPGLTLATQRPEVCKEILITFARFVDQGMLPNRFPDDGEAPEYNTVDAGLWYFEAVRAYYAATHDAETIKNLFPILEEMVQWHKNGTRYEIHLDPADGLLYAGQADVQLTWMDVKIGDWVVTPRTGKQVEINALWYNALHTMADFSRLLETSPDLYLSMANQVQKGFERFWNPEAGCCYDVLDGPGGNDLALRPNQLIAASLHHSPLTSEQQKQVVDICAHLLYTSRGLRSLAPNHAQYLGTYHGNQKQRDAAYHQGTVWGWLIGPFLEAHLRVYGQPELTYSYFAPFIGHLAEAGLGSVSEIFEGNPPHTAKGCISQAWSVAEMLRIWRLLENYRGQSGL